MSVSRAFLHTSLGNPKKNKKQDLLQKNLIFLEKSPVKELTAMFPNRVRTKKDAPFPEPMVYSLIYIRLSPQLRSFPTKWGEKIRSPSTDPHVDGTTYIQWGANWFPRAIVYDTAVTNPVPCSLQHDTFHLGLEKTRTPLASVCRTNPLQNVPCTPLPPPT